MSSSYTVADLERLMPPPFHPVSTSGDWENVEAKVGFKFPQDYREFMAIYGGGTIDDRLRIVSPFAGAALEALIEQRQGSLALQQLPISSALIPWGYNFEGGTAYWDARASDPNMWTVITEFDDDFESFAENMTSFIARVILGEETSGVLFSAASPFNVPVPYYPTFDAIKLRATFANPAMPLDEQAEMVMETLGPPAAAGTVVDFGIKRELQALVPRTGWSVRYGMYIGGSRSGMNELNLAVPKSESSIGESWIARVIQRLGVDISTVMYESEDSTR